MSPLRYALWFFLGQFLIWKWIVEELGMTFRRSSGKDSGRRRNHAKQKHDRRDGIWIGPE